MRINRNLPDLLPQPTSPSAEVLALRTSWKWAYLSHFLFTYNPILHLEDIQLSELEDDLASGTFEVIPTVMQRLLMSLTPHDKRMILEDWQQQLRKQSLKRAPDHNLMGTEDDPIDFASLIMSDKLDLFQVLCEWQFHNPNNLRARMRDDDEYANWRMEPIAYDAKENAYWLMGGNRLWVQYAPPRKRAPKSHKRKQPAATTTNGRKPAKRKQPNAAPSSKAIAPLNSKPKASASNPTSSRPIRETRSRGSLAGSSNQHKARIVGTRVSSRLRGREEEDVWQSIPEDWLKEEPKEDATDIQDEDQHSIGSEKGKGVETKATMKSLDDVSELTSLSDLSELPEVEEEEANEDEEGSTPTPPPELSFSNEDVWETLCVTLAEWEDFPQRFEKATHRAEKAFYKLLTNELVPMITEVLRVDVRKKVMEEAVVHRKRSSRIAVKESVREAERAEARRKAEEEKELERHRRWEARARKEEEDRVKRENMRSARLRERGRTGSESVDVDVVGDVSEGKLVLTNGTAPDSVSAATPVKFAVNVSKSGTQTPREDEPWELDCEICLERGKNLDLREALLCCESCNKWQHIRCHNERDFLAGRPQRNWEDVDFLCHACATNGQNAPRGSSSQQQSQPQNYFSNSQVWGQYNGATATANSGINALQPLPDHRAAVPAKSTFKQASYDAVPYNNGRTGYTLPQPHLPSQYPMSAVSPIQYAQRPQAASNAKDSTGYPTTASSQSRGPAAVAAPYTSAPNMYLSNYSGSYRPPQNLTAQSLQASSSTHYRPTMSVPQAGTWTQQQTQYNHLTNNQTWNGATHSSGSQPYAASATSATQPLQQNGYYRPHPVAPSNPLTQPNHLHPAQSYYSGGPSSQS